MIRMRGLERVGDHKFLLRSDADPEARAIAHAVERMEAFRDGIAYSALNTNHRREVDGLALKVIRHLLCGFPLRKEHNG